MGLFDKVKNLFTEEVEEESKPIKKEVRHVDVSVPAPTRIEREPIIEEEPEEEKKEEKFVFFSDEDFKDLEKPKVEEKPIIKEEKKPYHGNLINTVPEERKVFTPSPIISPVYGVLDKNYSKDEIVSKQVSPTRTYRSNANLSVDDVRNKAYGTIEDELKDSLLGKTMIEEEVEEINDIDIFEELEKYDNLDALEEKIEEKDNIVVDDLFDSLNDKKEEILDELDNKKEEILDELDSKKEDIIIDDDILLDDLDLDDETLELSRQLENQKRKLDEINDFIDEPEEDDIELENKDTEELNESELFDLIDSMYEKRDEE